jgi:hypothetical protein
MDRLSGIQSLGLCGSLRCHEAGRAEKAGFPFFARCFLVQRVENREHNLIR